MRALARLLLGALVAATLAMAVFAAGAGGGAATVHCKLAGHHYWGTTSQKKPVCITVSSDGSKLVEYSYGFHDSCGGSGTSWTRNPKRGYITTVSHGSFKDASMPPSFFKGVVSGSTAHGTFRDRTEVSGLDTCDTGVVHWTARQR